MSHPVTPEDREALRRLADSPFDMEKDEDYYSALRDAADALETVTTENAALKAKIESWKTFLFVHGFEV